MDPRTRANIHGVLAFVIAIIFLLILGVFFYKAHGAEKEIGISYEDAFLKFIGGKSQEHAAEVSCLTNRARYNIARAILGKDFITPEEVAETCLGITYTPAKLQEFYNTLPIRETLL